MFENKLILELPFQCWDMAIKKPTSPVFYKKNVIVSVDQIIYSCSLRRFMHIKLPLKEGHTMEICSTGTQRNADTEIYY